MESQIIIKCILHRIHVIDKHGVIIKKIKLAKYLIINKIILFLKVIKLWLHSIAIWIITVQINTEKVIIEVVVNLVI